MAFKQWVLNEKQFDLFVGSMLGDGSIKKNGNTGAYFRLSQTDWEYVDFKAKIMEDKISSFYLDDRKNSTQKVQKGFMTKTYQNLLKYKGWSPTDWLAELNEFSFCIWLLDDGWVKGTGTGYWNIACDRFSDEERAFAIRVVWELFRIQAHIVGKKRKHIAFSTDSTQEINEMILQNIPNVDIVKRKIGKTRVLTKEEQHDFLSKANRKISEEKTLLIDKLLKCGITHNDIAKQVGVTTATISRIRNRNSPYYRRLFGSAELKDRVKHC